MITPDSPSARRWPGLRDAAALAAALALCLSASGCSSLLGEGTAAGAGIAGASVAGALTDNAAVATGIGLGVQAGARAALQYSQRKIHAAAQDRIAMAAGPLAVDAVADWKTDHAVPLEPAEHGRVTVSREIGGKSLPCKEIVFSVDDDAKSSAFYIAAICRDGQTWKWASAEPATERWGSLQ
ncbi:lipoprotein [Cupriavidus basilensis OR16]|uniref:Lipoprotein n=1 Tax=Cupriavidus basilensis OR16 TaxID=1127483 RepID=H1S5M1_9BURK|nr:hypothetical protein [Cupriavidus basilensis]EHP42103.1 lipoprotein [Cupriavidus basilensis OR16]